MFSAYICQFLLEQLHLGVLLTVSSFSNDGGCSIDMHDFLGVVSLTVLARTRERITPVLNWLMTCDIFLKWFCNQVLEKDEGIYGMHFIFDTSLALWLPKTAK
jgi:hypothetical protein